ncbi:hypothetical protein BAUCODRAFT_32406 [Baudoinia panamericana UAMH 10762]|uniref:Major facilitator superfamily (MFS) profile domain-containing protein n=1 Tax=Baudoinia panamericana (strain UAMH 10762) TaxID=717646 RepID=M2NH71_BAUPA|nr:uncharacterized protein BAUCODRAFT_32406 [Baudoinia panamericana UAMH 10762]EMC98375.1 hypothetical protein BAUCODRAFT_32406 [Baudoinia panamericana UAMH 10762]
MAKSADPLKDEEVVQTADETTPLLGAPDTGPASIIIQNDDTVPPHANGHSSVKPTDDDGIPTDTDDQEQEEERPMPVGQILILCYACLAEPVAYFAIFPFINEMIFRLGGMPESSVGIWSGIVESLFSVVQMMLMIPYGRAADYWGRKPVLVWSLAGVGVATALFGFSRNLWQIILFRCCAGLFGGSVVTIRTMISENCTKLSQARAFSWYMFTRNLGIFVGPLIGSLANPADSFPGTFGHSTFFKEYPYALATIVCGSVTLSATLLCSFGLKETLHTREGGKRAQRMSTWEILKAPGVPMVLLIYTYTLGLSLAYTAVNPVFSFTDVSLGGLGFSDQLIAVQLAVVGASQSAWMLFGFPPLQKRFGTGNLYRGCAVAWPLLMAGFPVYNELLRHGMRDAFFGVFFPSLALGSGVAMSFACIQLFLNDIAPSSTVLATVNAIALTLNSAVRGVAPVAFTSLFALGVKIKWADGHLVWIVLTVLALGLNVAIYFLPPQAEGKYKQASASGQPKQTTSEGE